MPARRGDDPLARGGSRGAYRQARTAPARTISSADWLALTPVSLAVVSRHIPTASTIDKNNEVATPNLDGTEVTPGEGEGEGEGEREGEGGSLVDVARSLEPLIREHAQALEEGAIPPPLVEALYHAGVFKAMLPREVGASRPIPSNGSR